jgi:hypothetical protein
MTCIGRCQRDEVRNKLFFAYHHYYFVYYKVLNTFYQSVSAERVIYSEGICVYGVPELGCVDLRSEHTDSSCSVTK